MLHKCNYKPSLSTFIDEDTITAGYGKLDTIGCFEYQLSKKETMKLTGGFISWKEYTESKSH